ncbi:MAG: hypothetical protein ACLFQG_01310 [Desulfovermiculus sp.]
MVRFALGLALAVALAAPGAAAEPMDRALRLVNAHHPGLVAERAELDEVMGRSRWAAEVDLSMTETLSVRNSGVSGRGQVVLSLTIPLVGGDFEAEQARAVRDFNLARADVRDSFVASVSEIKSLALSVEVTEERRDFWKDQAEYYRQAVEEGIGEPDRLWSQAGSLQDAEHAYRDALVSLEAKLDEVSRKFGGAEWMSLRALLAEIAN